ncbi:hypothetical protein BP5796_07038 [Coleophoma crateriformis]|uniref:Uncharacterized protein n=1 Tax=Coleophoma crateriformis TaxID=565419 RepID=A0A3D8RI10_9HELO|nr:hypothetical protein BP5796_07038 [Coleophoma crateriformis]
MRFSSTLTTVFLYLVTGGSALFPHKHKSGMRVGPIPEDTELNGTSGFNGWGTFDQLLDHSSPHLGTFSQRYWYGTQYWNGSGSPIILTTPGEQAADGFNVTYTTELRLTGLMAAEMGGAVIVLEHRYWGESSPYDVLTVENLKYLTLDNALADLTYFANNFDAPFDQSGGSNPKNAPWIYAGGSYGGALAGWLEAVDPGTYWAYYGTSGVVEAVGDFWQYFAPVLEATPQNCSTDLIAVIDYVDNILLHGNSSEKTKLKDLFLLGDLEDADFASALQNGPWSWQDTQFYTESIYGYNEYYYFCDYVENVYTNPNQTVIPGAKGVGLEKALAGYAQWWTEYEFPGYCESYGYSEFNGTYNTECFKALNPRNVFYTDLTVSNAGGRQWMWLLCNEPLEYWQDGAPEGTPTIVSRLVNVAYWQTQCGFYFPTSQGGYGLEEGKTSATVNKYTGGWSNTKSKRLMYTNGQLDPWRDSTVSSDFRPGGPLQSTEQLPVRIVASGVHCSDLYGQNWAVNDAVKAIAYAEVAQMAGWVSEFYAGKSHHKRELEWQT